MMNPKAEALKARAKRFAIGVVELFRALPPSEEARVLGRQLLRSATSVAANYRAACRGRTKAEFVAKLGIVVEEADECVLWLELLEDCRVLKREHVDPLRVEAGELLAIFAASQVTAKANSSPQ